MTVRQTITAPLAGTLQSAFAGGSSSFGLFHEGGVVGERPPAVRYADAAVFDYAHRATTAAASLARGSCPTRSRSSPGAAGWSCRPSGSCVRKKTAREQRPITVVVNVTAADASSFRARPGPDRGRHGARDRPGEPEPVSGVQFRGAMEALQVRWRLPQLPQRSLRSRSSSLVYGGRPCAAAWRRCGSACCRPHRSRRPHARRGVLSRMA